MSKLIFVQKLWHFEVCNFGRISYKKYFVNLWSIKLKFLPGPHYIKTKIWSARFLKFGELAISCHFYTENLNFWLFGAMLKLHKIVNSSNFTKIQIFCLDIMRDWFKFQHDWEQIDRLVLIYLKYLFLMRDPAKTSDCKMP